MPTECKPQNPEKLRRAQRPSCKFARVKWKKRVMFAVDLRRRLQGFSTLTRWCESLRTSNSTLFGGWLRYINIGCT
eukprot:scaffold12715_cov31-Prasinocladus_malaysianus.AAC.1